MKDIKGARVLIIEDQPVVEMSITESLIEMGAIVAGSASTFADALKLVSTAEADAALVDIWLADRAAYSVGDILTQRGIPFVVISGAATREEPAAFRTAPRLFKPFKDEELLAALAAL
jgi:CheY-like chemotaxis protein